MKSFLLGYVAGALTLFLGLAYWHSYQNAKAIDRFRVALQKEMAWMRRGSPYE